MEEDKKIHKYKRPEKNKTQKGNWTHEKYQAYQLSKPAKPEDEQCQKKRTINLRLNVGGKKKKAMETQESVNTSQSQP
jgi:hypothetical protein